MATVQSIERAFEVLEALAREPAGVSDLATATGLPKSTVARLLTTLEGRGAVERAAGLTRYQLGPAIAELATAIAPSRNLIAVARPHLVDLTEAVGEASGLSVPDGYEVHYIDQAEGPNPVQVRDWTGSRIPMHVVSSGIVMLAHWPKGSVDAYLARDLARPTRNTVVDPAGIERKLSAARECDYAWVFEEFAEGINSIGSPIRNDSGAVVAALHVHGPAYRFPAERRDDVTSKVLDSAQRVSEQLGYRAA